MVLIRFKFNLMQYKLDKKVVIIDDLLATGGTLEASIKLCQKVGGEVVGCGVVIELDFLNGRNNLTAPCKSLVHY